MLELTQPDSRFSRRLDTLVGKITKVHDLMKGEQRMLLPRKPIQDISVIDVAGDIDFREMIRIKDTIGSLIEKERIKVVLNLRSVDHINYLSIGVLLERLKLLRNLNGDLKLAGMR